MLKAIVPAGWRRRCWSALTSTAWVELSMACSVLSMACATESISSGSDEPMSRLTAEEWQALQAPLPGEHVVYDLACKGRRVEQEFRVKPSVSCDWRREPGKPLEVRDCNIAEYCQADADCGLEPGGVCVGTPNTRCTYDGFPQATACEVDDDCKAAAGGSCVPQVEAGITYCDPTGECRVTQARVCSYPGLSELCSQDDDCTLAEGGRCEKNIERTRCEYNECATNEDCGPAARCECQGIRRCVPADCNSDEDCELGFSCAGSLNVRCGNLQPIAGYHCHAARDACLTDVDCDDPSAASCVYDPNENAWACRNIMCVTR